MIKKWDIPLYFILILVPLYLFYSAFNLKEIKAKNVEVFINGKLKYRYKLSKEKKIVQIEVANGIEEMEIKDNKVIKIKSTCKNRICEKQGHISNSGDSIICVPNKEIIKITGEEEESDYIIK